MKANIKISALILSLVLLVSVFAGFGTQNAALAEGDGPVMAKIKVRYLSGPENCRCPRSQA